MTESQRLGHGSDGDRSRLWLRVVEKVGESLKLGEWPQKIDAIGRLVDYGSLTMTIVLLCCVTCGVFQRRAFNAPPISRKFTYYSYAKITIFCAWVFFSFAKLFSVPGYKTQ